MDDWITGSDDAYFNDGPSSESHDDDGNRAEAPPLYRHCSVCMCSFARVGGRCPECGEWHVGPPAALRGAS